MSRTHEFTLSIPMAAFPETIPSPLVIPTGAKRSGGICSLRVRTTFTLRVPTTFTLSIPIADLPETIPSPLVIPTEAKRSGGICSLRVPTGSHSVDPAADLIVRNRTALPPRISSRAVPLPKVDGPGASTPPLTPTPSGCPMFAPAYMG